MTRLFTNFTQYVIIRWA